MNINVLHEQARGGDLAAEGRLFEELTARFRLFAQQKISDRQDVLEVVQDALTTVVEKHGEIEFKVSFAAWAHQVLKNKILYYYRTRATRGSRMEPLPEGVEPPDQWEPNPEFEPRLLDCLRKVCAVNRRHARILNLHYQGYSVEDICGRLNLTRGNFYSVLSRARSMLELCLDKGDVK